MSDDCRTLLDSTKCKLIVAELTTHFAAPNSHTELTTRCKECGRTYYFTITNPKIEDFGQIWRTAVAGKDFKPPA